MPCGVEEHSPPLRSGLAVRPASSEPYGLSLGTVQVVDCQIEVQLLGHGVVRPSRRDVVLHLHGGDPSPAGGDRHEGVRLEGDLATEERSPKGRQGMRIVAVQ